MTGGIRATIAVIPGEDPGSHFLSRGKKQMGPRLKAGVTHGMGEGGAPLRRLDQHMLLLAEAETQAVVGPEIGS